MCLMEGFQKSSQLYAGLFGGGGGSFDLYLLSPVTPWKLGGSCCHVKLSLKLLSVLLSPPPQSQATLDLLYLCPRHVWEHSCVHPTLPPPFYFSCSRALPPPPPALRPRAENARPKHTVLPSLTTPASNPEASLQAGFALGPLLRADVSDNLLIHTCTSQPHLADWQLKNVRL